MSSGKAYSDIPAVVEAMRLPIRCRQERVR
jgi:hypothetical protein